MKTRILVCILVILLFGISTQYSIADDFDWPRWRGPNGDGISTETNWYPKALDGGPNILWKLDIGMGYSNIAIKDNHLYTMGIFDRKPTMYCLDTETGEEIWRHVEKKSFYFPQSTPTINGKYVYALNSDGILSCLKAKNGKLRWKKDIVSEYNIVKPHYGFAGPPVIEEDLIIVTGNTSGLALDKNTGKKVWASEPCELENMGEVQQTGSEYAAPVIYNHNDKRFALIFSGKGLFSVDVNGGEIQWFYEWPYAVNAADPIIFDSKVFISSGYYIGCALLDISDDKPKVLWRNKNMGNHFSACVFIDGYIYGSDGNVGGLLPLRCIDFETGDVMWEKKMKMVSLIVADGKLIILEEDGTLHIAVATPLSYEEISSGDVLEGEQKLRRFWTPPVLCDGKIYCRNYIGDLICIDVRK